MANKKGEFFGPLRVSRRNPRYFEDGNGKTIFLTGSHTWANFQEFVEDGEAPFIYEEYLDMMESNHHNFMRMWQRNHPYWSLGSKHAWVDPVPYVLAAHNKTDNAHSVYDLDRWNEDYFARLRAKIIEAGQRGIYVDLMFFGGGESLPWMWDRHPYNAKNNCNGIGSNDNGLDVYSLSNPAMLQYQERLVIKVIDTLNDLDNLLFEIVNEIDNTPEAVKWHYHMVEFAKKYESTKPKQHVVGMTSVGGSMDNSVLFAGPADWISPGYGRDGEYKYNPPAADGSKVIINDTDHLWGLGGHYKWVWMSFLRGMHPIFMDPWRGLPEYTGTSEINTRNYRDYPFIRSSMGYALQYAERIDLAKMVPRNDLASTQFCLADPGNQYLVYSPQGGEVNVDLTGTTGMFHAEWFEPATGKTQIFQFESAGDGRWFVIPFAEDALLYIYPQNR